MRMLQGGHHFRLSTVKAHKDCLIPTDPHYCLKHTKELQGKWSWWHSEREQTIDSLFFRSPGGAAPRTSHGDSHPGSRSAYITQIPNIMWKVTYYPYHKHYMNRTVLMGQHTRDYGSHGPCIARHTRIHGPYVRHTRVNIPENCRKLEKLIFVYDI